MVAPNKHTTNDDWVERVKQAASVCDKGAKAAHLVGMEFARCECPICSFLALITSRTAVVYAVGAAALEGKPAAYEELAKFMDDLMERYDSLGNPTPDGPAEGGGS